MPSPRRTELELFEALVKDGGVGDLVELSARIARCAGWILSRRTPGGLALTGEVDEIVDTVLERLERLRARGFSGGAPEFRTYLYRTVASVCSDAAYRRRLVDSIDTLVSLPDGDKKPLADVLASMVDPHLAPLAALEGGEERGRVMHALESLGERCRLLLRRFHVDGVTIRDLARELGSQLNAVEVALTRCRTRLYVAFLAAYLKGGRQELREQVSAAVEQMSGLSARVFRAWWFDNRTVSSIGEELQIPPAEVRRALADAKRQVWRLLAERQAT
jgi:RNA polymerase sigma factor (sigma-70 family)